MAGCCTMCHVSLSYKDVNLYAKKGVQHWGGWAAGVTDELTVRQISRDYCAHLCT